MDRSYPRSRPHRSALSTDRRRHRLRAGDRAGRREHARRDRSAGIGPGGAEGRSRIARRRPRRGGGGWGRFRTTASQCQPASELERPGRGWRDAWRRRRRWHCAGWDDADRHGRRHGSDDRRRRADAPRRDATERWSDNAPGRDAETHPTADRPTDSRADPRSDTTSDPGSDPAADAGPDPATDAGAHGGSRRVPHRSAGAPASLPLTRSPQAETSL